MKKVWTMFVGTLVLLAAFSACTVESKEEAQEMPTGKIVINFEGTIASIDENRITLEDGMVVVFEDSTAFTNAGGTVTEAELSEGDSIQGYTADDLEAAEVTAKRIHIIG